jgi:hypothetical protein
MRAESRPALRPPRSARSEKWMFWTLLSKRKSPTTVRGRPSPCTIIAPGKCPLRRRAWTTLSDKRCVIWNVDKGALRRSLRCDASISTG